MNLSTFFTLRLTTKIADIDFTSEVQCDDVSAVRATFSKLQEQNLEINMPAALIGIDLSKPGSCHQLDGFTDELFGNLLEELHVGAEHFLNNRLGSYDHLNNVVTPSDLGTVFPNGTMRLVWKEEQALLGFGQTLQLVKGALELLLQAQELPYFRETDDEINANDSKSVVARRLELLFRAGLWPSTDNDFEPETTETTAASLLAEYANRVVAEEVSA